MSPTVSVIIPAYNQAQFVSQAIESVLAQTFTDYEIIVVNDGSTDNTAQVLAGYGDCLQVITQANAGLSAARNSGLKAAQGEFIAFLDADDLWYPHMLATTVAHLQQNPEIDLVCGAWDLIDESGQMFRPANKPSNLRARVRADLLRALATGNLFLVHALLIRKKCFACCGDFDTTLKAVEDWDLWTRMAIHGHKVDMIDAPVARYRRHRANMSLDVQRMEQASRQVLVKLFANEQLTDRLAGLQDHAYIQMRLVLALYCHEGGADADSRRFVQQAQELYQKAPKNKEVDQLHLSSLLLLPDTDEFKRMIVASSPETIVRYYCRRGYQLFRDGNYKLMVERLKPSNILIFLLGFKDALWGLRQKS